MSHESNLRNRMEWTRIFECVCVRVVRTLSSRAANNEDCYWNDPSASFIHLSNGIIVWFRTLFLHHIWFWLHFPFDTIDWIWTALLWHTHTGRNVLPFLSTAKYRWVYYIRTKLLDLEQSILRQEFIRFRNDTLWEQFKWNCVQNNFTLESVLVSFWIYSTILIRHWKCMWERERETWPIRIPFHGLRRIPLARNSLPSNVADGRQVHEK